MSDERITAPLVVLVCNGKKMRFFVPGLLEDPKVLRLRLGDFSVRAPAAEVAFFSGASRFYGVRWFIVHFSRRPCENKGRLRLYSFKLVEGKKTNL